MDTGPVVIVGGGPSGIAAALAASRTHQVILLEERPALHCGGEPATLLTKLRDDGVDVRLNTSAWALLPGSVIAAFDATRSWQVDASAVVIATGTVDVAWPIPGWQLKGVVTLGELLNDDGRNSLAGAKRFGVVGAGENVLGVVERIEHSGGRVVLETSDIGEARIEGTDRVERLRDAGRVAEVDTVVLALGQRPDPTLALQARAKSAFDHNQHVEMPWLAVDGATSLPGVFVAGGAAGKTTADAATSHGEAAGLAAAAGAAGGRQAEPLQAPALAAISLPTPEEPDTIICRDQMVDLRTIHAAIERGAYDINDLRRQTRAGMGPTQGRDTLPVLARLMQQAHPAIDDARLIARVRPPARPIPFRMALNLQAAD